MTVQQAHDSHGYFPVRILNGFLRSVPNRHAPTTDRDYSPREFRRYVDASGAQQVMLNNGMRNRIATGLRVPFVSYLYAAEPRIPGQMRDDYGGKHKRGIGPLQYRNAFREGPGSQPMDPGGTQSRQMMGDYLYNPMTS